eukprot:1585950-Prymnesium_polylepis.1
MGAAPSMQKRFLPSRNLTPTLWPTGGWQMVVRRRGRAAQRRATTAATGGRKSRAAKAAAGMPPGMSGPM